MANSEYTIRVRVQGGADVEAIKKALEGLGASVTRTRSSIKDADKSSGDFYDTQKKGIIGTANSTKSFSKLAETIGGRSNGLVAAYAELAANAFALTAAFNALRGASQVEQVFRGLEAAGSRTGQALTVSAKALREVTGAAIDTEQSLRSTAQIASAGFGEDTIKALGQAARDTSFALGRNMTDSLDRLTRGVVKLEPELLDELGIMTKLTESNTNYASKLGKTESQLTNFEKRQGFLNAVLAEAQLKFGGLSEEAGDSTAYDKLAASLTDLKNNVLSITNSALKPLAAILASSPTALLGVVILFGSTLAGKLLPFLASSVTTTKAAADAARLHATELKKSTLAAIENAKAQEQLNISRLRDFSNLRDAGPRIYQQMNDKIKAGTATVKDYDAAVTSLQRRIRADQGLIQNNPKYAPGTADGADRAQRITDARLEIARIREVQRAEEELQKTQVGRSFAVRQARLQATAATLTAMAQEKAAAAVGAAAERNFSQAVVNSTGATLAYARALAVKRQAQIEATNDPNAVPPVALMDRLRTGVASAKSGVGSLWTALASPRLAGVDKARVAIFGLGTAARAAGAGFLAMIPVIGQIIFALSLAKMGLDAMKSDAVKKLEKAFEDFKQVTDSTDKSISALNRTQTSTASLALRTQQAIVIQSNAISTLVDAYDDLVAKQDEVATKGKGGSNVAGFFDSLSIFGNSSTNYASNILNIDKTSKALKAFDADLPTIFSPTAGVDKDPVLSGSIVTLEKLRKLAPEATEKAIAFAGGWERFSKLPLEQKIATVTKIANDVKSQYGDAAEKVTSLVDAFKNLNQSIGDFALSQQQSTPFDQVVKGFQAVNNGIQDFQSTAAKTANVSADQYKGLLSGMGSNIESFLNVDTKKQLDEFRKLNDQVQQIEARRAQGLDIDERALTNLKARRDAQTGVLDAVNSQLQSTQRQFELAQEQDRVYKSIQSTLQANLTANQANYAATASGVKARMEGENRIKQLQISQLQVQKGIIESYIAQNRAQIDSLKNNIELIKSTYDFNKAIDEGNVLYRQRAAHLRQEAAAIRLNAALEAAGSKDTAESADFSPGFAADLKRQLGDAGGLVDAYQKAKKDAEGLDKLQSDYQGVQRAEQAIKGYESSVSSLVNQINALAISENTSGQIAAEAAAKRAEIINQQTQQLLEQKKTLESIQTLDIQTNRLLQGRSDTLSDQVSDIQRAAIASRAQYDNEHQNARRTLESELAKARADSAVARDAGAKQANKDRIALLEEQVRLEDQGYRINLLQLDAQTRNQLVQKAAFDTQSQGLQMQQDALSYLEKQLQARKELVDAAQEESTLTAEVARRRRGVGQTADSKMSDEIMAAKAAYDYAVDEASLRRATIQLEYALLDAQRQNQLADLQTRRTILAQTQGANSEMVKQLDATIQGLQNASDYISRGQAAALSLVDRQVSSAYRKLQLAALPEGTGTSNIGEFRRNRNERIALQRDALNGNMKRDSVTSAFEPAIAPFVKASTDNIEAIRSSTNVTEQLVRVNQQLVDKQKGLESGTNSTLSRLPLNIQAAAQKAIAQGFRVSELSGYGGVTAGVHKGAGHAEGRAFDLNIGTGNVEANDPAMRARMDRMAEEFRKEGYTVLWKVAGHFNHMHVEVARNAQKSLEAQANLVEDTKKKADAAIVANDNTADVTGPDIVVTAKRPDFAVPKITNADLADSTKIPAQSEFLDLYREVMAKSGSVQEIFTKMADDLGPQGQIVPAILSGINSIGDSYLQMLDKFNDDSAKPADKIQAVAAVMQQALGTIQSVLSASAAAKEDAIQREIDAEQKRDGKSAESVAKIASLEKKKDEIARKQFNTNKKLQMAQAVIATAAGVAQALAYGPIVGPILAGVIAAMGAAQIAIIAGTQYQSSASTTSAVAETPTLTIGKRGDSVDLAKQNNNVGGELGYLRGSQGTGGNSSNYSVIGSAYGGDLPRGYGNAAYVVGEKGPETLMADTPISVRPANDNAGGNPVNATINIHALDAHGVEDVLRDQKGNLISMFREAANANGQPFLEDVNVATYSRPNKTANSRL